MSTWPAVMRNPSKDLKRCLCKTGENADNKTLFKELEKLGYNRSVQYIVTTELEQRILKNQTSSGQVLSFSGFKSSDPEIEKLLG